MSILSLDSLFAGARRQLRRYCLRMVLVAFAGLIAVMGLVMLVGSVFLRLAACMAVPSAAAVTGGGLLIAAGLTVLAVRLLGRRKSRRPEPAATPREPINANVAAIAELLAAARLAIDRDARSESPSFAIMALLAGCAIGASPKLRRTIADLASR